MELSVLYATPSHGWGSVWLYKVLIDRGHKLSPCPHKVSLWFPFHDGNEYSLSNIEITSPKDSQDRLFSRCHEDIAYLYAELFVFWRGLPVFVSHLESSSQNVRHFEGHDKNMFCLSWSVMQSQHSSQIYNSQRNDWGFHPSTLEQFLQQAIWILCTESCYIHPMH